MNDELENSHSKGPDFPTFAVFILKELGYTDGLDEKAEDLLLRYRVSRMRITLELANQRKRERRVRAKKAEREKAQGA